MNPIILDFERSVKWYGFFVFVSVYNINCQNNASISVVVFDGKVNILSALYRGHIVKSKHFPTIFQKFKKTKIIDGKTGILA